MNCNICEIIKNKLGQIYEDEDIYAYLSPNPITLGHIIVVPKQHFTIFEQVPDYIVNKLFTVVNTLSMISFENLNIQGTNILVNNGISAGQSEPHFLVNIIPRTENDGINLTWTPKQLDEEDISTIELQYKEFTEKIVEFKPEKKVDIPQPIQKEELPKHTEEDNYLIKHLTRIP